MRIIFFGSPDFSCPSLKALIQSHHRIDMVITQPDRPKGRGQRLYPPPVKSLALEAGLRVEQPEKISQAIELLRQMKPGTERGTGAETGTEAEPGIGPEIGIVIAYGKILPKELLVIPIHGCINVHGSLLPKYRGASPIHWAIMEGDEKTGITTMQMDEGMDTGDILLQREIPIIPGDTAGTLSERMAASGADLLMETLALYESGRVVRLKQNNELATYTRLLKKADGIIDWNQPADRICRLIRGLNPWPGAFSYLNRRRIKVLQAYLIGPPEVAGGSATGSGAGVRSAGGGDAVVSRASVGDAGALSAGVGDAGKIVRANREEGLVVKAGQNTLLGITQVQPEGKRVMAVWEYIQGSHYGDLEGRQWSSQPETDKA